MTLPTFNTGTTRANGVTLYYEEAGAGTPVVLLHGYSLNATMWDPQVPQLASQFHVLRYDRRGCGRSESSLTGYDEATMAADLADLLRQRGIESSHLVGASMGGFVAAAFALLYSPMVLSLTLVAPYLGAIDLPVAAKEEFGGPFNALVDRVRAGDLAAARRIWLDNPLFASLRTRPALLRTVERMVAICHFPDLLSASPPPAGPSVADRLSTIVAPTRVIIGSRDIALFQHCAAVYQERIPGCRSVTIPEAGHMVNLEQPEALNTTLCEFLAGHE